MQERLFQKADFDGFLRRTGLSYKNAAVVLGVSEITVQRGRTGKFGVKNDVAEKAVAWEASTRTTVGKDGDALDNVADQMELASLCAALPHAFVTGLTAAIARGWTSAVSNGFRHVCQPVRMKMPDQVDGFDLEWTTTDDLLWGIECRQDSEGNPYRIASIERILVDMIDNEGLYGEAAIDEVFLGAFKLAEQTPDVRLIWKKIGERGPQAYEAMREYIKKYL
jgi:hypothetical protein